RSRRTSSSGSPSPSKIIRCAKRSTARSRRCTTTANLRACKRGGFRATPLREMPACCTHSSSIFKQPISFPRRGFLRPAFCSAERGSGRQNRGRPEKDAPTLTPQQFDTQKLGSASRRDSDGAGGHLFHAVRRTRNSRSTPRCHA